MRYLPVQQKATPCASVRTATTGTTSTPRRMNVANAPNVRLMKKKNKFVSVFIFLFCDNNFNEITGEWMYMCVCIYGHGCSSSPSSGTPLNNTVCECKKSFYRVNKKCQPCKTWVSFHPALWGRTISDSSGEAGLWNRNLQQASDLVLFFFYSFGERREKCEVVKLDVKLVLVSFVRLCVFRADIVEVYVLKLCCNNVKDWRGSCFRRLEKLKEVGANIKKKKKLLCSGFCEGFTIARPRLLCVRKEVLALLANTSFQQMATSSSVLLNVLSVPHSCSSQCPEWCSSTTTLTTTGEHL